ncbi:tRNA lysidine(34) synthetase TilS [Cellulosilyticum ruminicola]|uniref:tRNA lysidine(34) synthetase TilS n=1 Tax=Cellulosilyticum ruminicola TaxID=425254 RepID=UPI0006D0DB4D|nr:tRNA lysidine(34) synthetase TilS [Cellulosilyticum ruminicola]
MSNKKIEYKLQQYIKQHKLLQTGDDIVIGVSGGADSMMLFHYLYTHREEYGIHIKVAHVNHGIREEAEGDAAYVEEVCRKWQVPFYRQDCNIKDLAKKKQLSEEEAGREERYNFFISLLNQNGKIATAHNMNDQAETLIMRFIRGTDIKGLGGISPKRGEIIRPLLCLTRAEIEEYCRYYTLFYKDDHTNFLPIYTRNKIRLKCIPYIEKEISPGVIKTLGQHSELYREEENFLREHTELLFKDCSNINNDFEMKRIELDVEKLSVYHSYMQKRIIYLTLFKLTGKSKNITSKHIDTVLKLINGQSGKEVHMPYETVVEREYNTLIFRKIETLPHTYCYPLSLGKHYIKEANLEIELRILANERIHQKSENMYTKYIDYGKMKSDFCIRTRHPYDYIRLGSGSKKLKKLFTDDKIPKAKRDSIPLIATGDEIVWVVAGRLNTDYYITEETTQILQIRITYRN